MIKANIEKRKNRKLWTLFIDLKSAFDTVDHEILMTKLRKIGISLRLRESIGWLYDQTKIVANNKEHNIGAGVIQGGVLSPTLFLVMFNDLRVKLEEAGIEAFAYADDLGAHGFGKDKLIQGLNICEQ